MGEDVARPQAREHIERRAAGSSICAITADRSRSAASSARSSGAMPLEPPAILPDAHLHADHDHRRCSLDDTHAFRAVEQADVAALAEHHSLLKPKMPGKEMLTYARILTFERLDDMAAEASKIARPRRCPHR